MADTGHCQPPGSAGQSLALQAGTGSAVSSGRPGFLDVGVHGLRDPLTVYSASRSAGVGGRTVRAALCPPACRRAHPPAKPGLPRWPHPVPPAMPSPRGTLPGQTHIWGSSSKQPARRLGSRLSQQRGLSGGSLSWAAACGWGGRTWGVTRPTHWYTTARPAQELQEVPFPPAGWGCWPDGRIQTPSPPTTCL